MDLTAPMAVVEAVDAAVAACLAAAPQEFTGARIVALDERGAAVDANKAALDISYELSHAGALYARTPIRAQSNLPPRVAVHAQTAVCCHTPRTSSRSPGHGAT